MRHLPLMRSLFAGFVLCMGVLSACDSRRSGAKTEELIGQWSSARISYPNDPVFKNTQPDKVPGSARLEFRRNGYFFFTWDDTDISGRYHIDGQKLILTGASRGIGHATVKRFSSAGWRVITCSRQPFPEDCPWEMGPEDHIQVDLADYDSI